MAPCAWSCCHPAAAATTTTAAATAATAAPQELEEVCGLLQAGGLPSAAERAQQLRWPDRLALTQPLLATREPLLALRRQLAELMQVRSARMQRAAWLAPA